MYGAGWYGLNAARAYPLDEKSSGLDDNGVFLAENILVDAKIRFLGSSSERAHVSELVIGDYVSLIISVDETPIASILKARNEITAYEPVEITSIDKEASGWVVFGELRPKNDVKMTFSTPEQSFLSHVAVIPQLGSKYSRRFGVYGLRIDGEYPRYLSAGNDVRVERRSVNIDGKDVIAITVGLSTSLSGANAIDLNLTAGNILTTYAGDCGRRPESRTCVDPQPIETINGVTADCCGRIFIELRGCGSIHKIRDYCGLAIACDFTVDQACPPSPEMPDDQGRIFPDPEEQCPSDETTGTSSQSTQPPMKWWQIDA